MNGYICMKLSSRRVEKWKRYRLYVACDLAWVIVSLALYNSVRSQPYAS